MTFDPLPACLERALQALQLHPKQSDECCGTLDSVLSELTPGERLSRWTLTRVELRSGTFGDQLRITLSNRGAMHWGEMHRVLARLRGTVMQSKDEPRRQVQVLGDIAVHVAVQPPAVELRPAQREVCFHWSRYGAGYEVSSQGDKRFSAFYAMLEDGQSIEYHYQVNVKGYPSVREGKGRPPLRAGVDLFAEYLQLWRRWAQRNDALMHELSARAQSCAGLLTDKFATTRVNQAHALSVLLNERCARGASSS